MIKAHKNKLDSWGISCNGKGCRNWKECKLEWTDDVRGWLRSRGWKIDDKDNTFCPRCACLGIDREGQGEADLTEKEDFDAMTTDELLEIY